MIVQHARPPRGLGLAKVSSATVSSNFSLATKTLTPGASLPGDAINTIYINDSNRLIPGAVNQDSSNPAGAPIATPSLLAARAAQAAQAAADAIKAQNMAAVPMNVLVAYTHASRAVLRSVYAIRALADAKYQADQDSSHSFNTFFHDVSEAVAVATFIAGGSQVVSTISSIATAVSNAANNTDDPVIKNDLIVNGALLQSAAAEAKAAGVATVQDARALLANMAAQYPGISDAWDAINDGRDIPAADPTADAVALDAMNVGVTPNYIPQAPPAAAAQAAADANAKAAALVAMANGGNSGGLPKQSGGSGSYPAGTIYTQDPTTGLYRIATPTGSKYFKAYKELTATAAAPPSSGFGLGYAGVRHRPLGTATSVDAATYATDTSTPTSTWLVVGAAAVALIGGIAYAMHRFKSADA